MHFSLLFLFSFFVLSSSYAGVFSYNTWKKNDIKVCFSDGIGEWRANTVKWSRSKKKLVREVVEEEFTPEKTGIFFSGFDDCRRARYKPDVIIYAIGFRNWVKGSYGKSTIGKGKIKNPDFPSAHGFIELTSFSLDKVTIVHEFGHSAGLLHEHDHYKAFANNPFCSSTKMKTKKSELVGYSEYDERSIMNYCYIESRMGDDIGLSYGDQEVLRSLYLEQW